MLDIAPETAGGYTVRTRHHAIKARDVVICTNGYSGSVWSGAPWVRNRIVPVYAHQICTEVISDALMKDVKPSGRAVVDSKTNIFWDRPTPDDKRIIFGARTGHDDGDLRITATKLRDLMVMVYPQLKDTRISHVWRGVMGFSFDHLPHIGQTRDGVYFATGFCGSGLPLGTYFGQKVGHKLVGNPEGETEWWNHGFPTWPFYNGNPWWLPAYIRWTDFNGPDGRPRPYRAQRLARQKGTGHARMDGIFTPDFATDPWWWHAAPRREPEPARPLPGAVDVLVVGAGYTGLNCARITAAAGRDTLVLDAQNPGAGASTRLAGYIGRFPHISFDGLESRHGPERAEAMWREAGDAHFALLDLIEREQMEVAKQYRGRFTAACTPAHYEALARNAEAVAKRVPFAFSLCPANRQREEVGTDYWHGGLILEEHGTLHPGLYHDALIDAVARAGARIEGRTPVLDIAPETGRL